MAKKQFLYIVQSSLEPAKCKIGITDNLERRLREYNATTGQSKDNIYAYLFTCEVRNMREIESDIKHQFPHLREQASREIYFFNRALFDSYVDFIRSHKHFKREVFLKPEEKKTVVKIVKKITPTLKERGMSRKDVMQRAKKVNNDEFYTRYEDVEKEVSMYPAETWRGKCVFCNCDDAVGETRTEKDSSAFALFFIKNFIALGLKKLICTHYSGQMDLFHAGAKGYVFTKNGVHEMAKTPRGYTGCFEDPLSLKILHEEADIVCTNPPFSRARDYWRTVMDSGKSFLIISNITNCKNAAYLPYFINGKVWAGYNRVDWFLNPKREPVQAAGHWFTNFPISERPKSKNLKLIPLNEIPERNKRFDDSGVLCVDNCFAPNDYTEQFAVSPRPILNGILEKGYNIKSDREYVPYFGGKRGFGRILIQRI
ncbi:MAG: adenine-specific methyltransferase EcoRI family protein [Candidatus Spyradosoma sp.]